jgi:hypothetical protein
LDQDGGLAQLSWGKETAMSSIDISTFYPKAQHAFLAFAQNVAKCLDGNTSLPSPPVPVTALNLLIDAYQLASADARTGARGTATVRKDKRVKVEEALDLDASYVQYEARKAVPTDVDTLIARSGYKRKKVGKKNKPEYAVDRGTVEGSAVARVKALGRTGTVQYFHEVSLDGGTSWQARVPTTKAALTFTGLPVGQTVRFRFRALINEVFGDWSQEIEYVVT